MFNPHHQRNLQGLLACVCTFCIAVQSSSATEPFSVWRPIDSEALITPAVEPPQEIFATEPLILVPDVMTSLVSPPAEFPAPSFNSQSPPENRMLKTESAVPLSPDTESDLTKPAATPRPLSIFGTRSAKPELKLSDEQKTHSKDNASRLFSQSFSDAPAPSLGDLWKLIPATIPVLVLALVVALIVKRNPQIVKRTSQQQAVRRIESLAIGPRACVHLIAVHGENFLVATDSQGIKSVTAVPNWAGSLSGSSFDAMTESHSQEGVCLND